MFPDATRWMISLAWLIFAITLVQFPSHLLAGRGVFTYDRIVDEDMTIVLATISNVAKAEQARAGDPKKIDLGFWNCGEIVDALSAAHF